MIGIIGKFKIEIKVKEQALLENALNLAHQGCRDYAILLLTLYAMEQQWKFDELSYYLAEMKAYPNGGKNGR
jgi:hypothetical protein